MHESRGLQQGEVVFYQHSLCTTFIELDKEAEDKLFEMFSEEEVREAFGGKRADDKGYRPS